MSRPVVRDLHDERAGLPTLRPPRLGAGTCSGRGARPHHPRRGVGDRVKTPPTPAGVEQRAVGVGPVRLLPVAGRSSAAARPSPGGLAGTEHPASFGPMMCQISGHTSRPGLPMAGCLSPSRGDMRRCRRTGGRGPTRRPSGTGGHAHRRPSGGSPASPSGQPSPEATQSRARIRCAISPSPGKTRCAQPTCRMSENYHRRAGANVQAGRIPDTPSRPAAAAPQ